MSNKKGFTLIEILVAIVIVGILASIILASLTSSRNKSSGASFKTTISSMKSAIAVCCSTQTNTLRIAGPGGALLCSSGTTSTLPTPSNLLATTATYLGGVAACSNALHRIRVVVAGSKNTSCNGTYYINETQVRNGNVFATSVVGFPAGC